ncbi:MAG: ATP-dependent nuclease [Planctomycetota bacterium]|jgi:AAA15 family ATPase/GTPase
MNTSKMAGKGTLVKSIQIKNSGAMMDTPTVIKKGTMIKSIQIKNYKGITCLDIKDFKSINIFMGPNGAGKTSILEVLYSDNNTVFLGKDRNYEYEVRVYQDFLDNGNTHELIKQLNNIGPTTTDIFYNLSKGFFARLENRSLPLKVMGSGYRGLFDILIHLHAAEFRFKTLLIDELENGLHPKTLPIVWEALLSHVINRNIQIFVTTHSYEAIHKLLVILKESGNEELVNFFLIKKTEGNKKHKCYRYDAESIWTHIYL